MNVQIAGRYRTTQTRRSTWWWAGVLMLSAVFLQIVRQAEDAGQVIRTLLLGLDPAQILGGAWTEVVFSSTLLVMLVAAVIGFGPRRMEAVRKERPVAFWAFYGGIAMQAAHVGVHAAAALRGSSILASSPLAGRVMNAQLLQFEMNFAILITMTVGFLAFRQTREPLLQPAVADRKSVALKAAEAEGMMNVARLARAEGRVSEARELFTEALASARAAGDHTRVARALTSLGELAIVRNDPAAGLAYFREVLEMAEDVVRLEEVGVQLRRDAARAMRAGDGPLAASLLWQRLLAARIVDAESLAQGLTEAARLAALNRNASRAAQLYGAVETLRDAISMSLTARPRSHAAGRSAGEGLRQAYGEAWERGRMMPPHAVVRFALETERAIEL